MGGLLVVTGVLFITGGMTTVSYWLLETFPGPRQHRLDRIGDNRRSASRAFLSPQAAGEGRANDRVGGHHAETLLPCHRPCRRRGDADEVRNAQGAAQDRRPAHARPCTEGGGGERRRRTSPWSSDRAWRRSAHSSPRRHRTPRPSCRQQRLGTGHAVLTAKKALARGDRRRARAFRRHAAGDRRDAEAAARGARARRRHRRARLPPAGSRRLWPADHARPAARRDPRGEGRQPRGEGDRSLQCRRHGVPRRRAGRGSSARSATTTPRANTT